MSATSHSALASLSVALRSVALRDPVSGVVQRACAELQQLLEQRREIKRRMKTLRQTLRGLRQGVGHSSENSSAALIAQPSDTPRDLHCNFRSEHLPPGRSRLHRACRIALLEAGGKATPEEIYLRILRRGSFSFRYRESPVAAIARVLGMMKTEETSARI